MQQVKSSSQSKPGDDIRGSMQILNLCCWYGVHIASTDCNY